MSGSQGSADPQFFGFGSLVNLKTHQYGGALAYLPNWRRVWVKTTLRPFPFLSIEPCAGCKIAGMIATVPDADWAALDAREFGYGRTDIRADLGTERDVAAYVVKPEIVAPEGDTSSILLSYLEVVVQGYLEHFGTDGVQGFFDTTANWDIPILNDRSAPLYPRHQHLSTAETTLVNGHIARLALDVLQQR